MLSVIGRPVPRLISGALRKATFTMADALAKIPDVEIDPEGTFKYILVRVKVKDGDVNKDIVRGTKSAEYHSKLLTSLLQRRIKCVREDVQTKTQMICIASAARVDLEPLTIMF